jgi:septal ring factor EnvC (AmiA/AmiB activator)
MFLVPRHRFFVAMLLSGLSLSLISYANEKKSAQSAEIETNQTKEQLEQLRSQISNVTAALNQSLTERQELNNALRSTEIELGQLSQQRQITDQAISTQRQRINELSEKQKTLQAERNTQKLLIERQLVNNWQLSRQNELKLLLNQESPETISRIMVYATYLNRARLDVLQQHKTTLDELDVISSKMQAETSALMESRLIQEKNRQALDQERQERQVTLAALEATIATQDGRLQNLIRDRNALEELLKSVEEAITQLKPEGIPRLPFIERQGKMSWPAKGKRKHNFGDRRADGKLRWDGALITARASAPVNAIHQGQVVFADWFRGMGLLIIIDHGDGYLSLYAHNQSLLRDTGEWVQPGETIATVGDSGGQANSGLYFEIRHQSQPLDPALWCK